MGALSPTYCQGRKTVHFCELEETRATFVEHLRDWRDDETWDEFFRLYSGLIYGQATSAGLNDADSKDVLQETLLTVARHIAGFRHEPGKHAFRAWVYRLAKSKIVDRFRREKPEARAWRENPLADNLSLDEIARSDIIVTEGWSEQDWEQGILDLAVAATILKSDPKDYQLFDLCVFQGVAPRKVAEFMRVPRTTVYLAKFRVGRVFKKEMLRLRKKHEDEPIPHLVRG